MFQKVRVFEETFVLHQTRNQYVINRGNYICYEAAIDFCGSTSSSGLRSIPCS